MLCMKQWLSLQNCYKNKTQTICLSFSSCILFLSLKKGQFHFFSHLPNFIYIKGLRTLESLKLTLNVPSCNNYRQFTDTFYIYFHFFSFLPVSFNNPGILFITLCLYIELGMCVQSIWSMDSRVRVKFILVWLLPQIMEFFYRLDEMKRYIDSLKYIFSFFFIYIKYSNGSFLFYSFLLNPIVMYSFISCS